MWGAEGELLEQQRQAAKAQLRADLQRQMEEKNASRSIETPDYQQYTTYDLMTHGGHASKMGNQNYKPTNFQPKQYSALSNYQSPYKPIQNLPFQGTRNAVIPYQTRQNNNFQNERRKSGEVILS